MTPDRRSRTSRAAGLRVEAAFFDLDKTVIAKASMAAFGGPSTAAGSSTARTVLRASSPSSSTSTSARARERSTGSASPSSAHQGLDAATGARDRRGGPREVVEPIIYAEAIDLIEQHRAAGGCVVHRLGVARGDRRSRSAAYLGVDAAIASRARDRRGRPLHGRDGVLRLRAVQGRGDARSSPASEGIDLAASYAYSDSYTDLPMLETVGHPVAVNPDRVLAQART